MTTALSLAPHMALCAAFGAAAGVCLTQHRARGTHGHTQPKEHRMTEQPTAPWGDRHGPTPEETKTSHRMLRSKYPAHPGAATMAADMCPRCKGDNAEAWALCARCQTAAQQPAAEVEHLRAAIESVRAQLQYDMEHQHDDPGVMAQTGAWRLGRADGLYRGIRLLEAALDAPHIPA